MKKLHFSVAALCPASVRYALSPGAAAAAGRQRVLHGAAEDVARRAGQDDERPEYAFVSLVFCTVVVPFPGC